MGQSVWPHPNCDTTAPNSTPISLDHYTIYLAKKTFFPKKLKKIFFSKKKKLYILPWGRGEKKRERERDRERKREWEGEG